MLLVIYTSTNVYYSKQCLDFTDYVKTAVLIHFGIRNYGQMKRHMNSSTEGTLYSALHRVTPKFST